MVEAFIHGWIQKRLIGMYADRCKELSEEPKIKVLKEQIASQNTGASNISGNPR